MKVSLIPPNQFREVVNILDNIPSNFIQYRLIHETYIPEVGITIHFRLIGMM